MGDASVQRLHRGIVHRVLAIRVQRGVKYAQGTGGPLARLRVGGQGLAQGDVHNIRDAPMLLPRTLMGLPWTLMRLLKPMPMLVSRSEGMIQMMHHHHQRLVQALRDQHHQPVRPVGDDSHRLLLAITEQGPIKGGPGHPRDIWGLLRIRYRDILRGDS